MYSLPGRASDAGPEQGACPCGAPSGCGPKSWDTLGDCNQCGTKCCDQCAVETSGDLLCGTCVAKLVARLMEEGDVCDCRFTGDMADASDCALHGPSRCICTCGHDVAEHGFRDACHVRLCSCPGFLASDPEPIGWMNDEPAPF